MMGWGQAKTMPVGHNRVQTKKKGTSKSGSRGNHLVSSEKGRLGGERVKGTSPSVTPHQRLLLLLRRRRESDDLDSTS